MKSVTLYKQAGWLAVCGLALLPVRPALAVDFDVISEEVTVVEVEKTAKPDLVGPSEAYAGMQYRSSADVKKGGAFSAPTFGAGGSVPFNLSEDIKLRLVLNYRAVLYNFNKEHKTTGPLGSIPWDAVNTYTLAAIAQAKIDDQWALFGGPFVRASAEMDADHNNWITGGALVGFKYFHSDTLTLGLALMFASQLEDDAVFAPLPMVDWRFAETMKFRLGMNHTGAVNGYGADLEWDFKENWGAGIGIQFIKERFRLDNNGAGKDGIGQDTSLPLFVKLGYKVTDKLDVEMFAGTTLGGELRMQTKTGKGIQKNKYEAQPFLGVRASLAVF